MLHLVTITAGAQDWPGLPGRFPALAAGESRRVTVTTTALSALRDDPQITVTEDHGRWHDEGHRKPMRGGVVKHAR